MGNKQQRKRKEKIIVYLRWTYHFGPADARLSIQQQTLSLEPKQKITGKLIGTNRKA